MTVQEVRNALGKRVTVKTRSVDGEYIFTAYIFRIKDNKKLYQAEVQNPNPPHEIYTVRLDDVELVFE